MEQELMKINANGVLTIPARFRKAGFAANHYVNVSLEEDGSLRLVAVEAIPRDQLGFHTKSWLDKERKASRDLAQDNIKIYPDKKTFLKHFSK